MTTPYDDLLKEINDRLTAMDGLKEAVSEERIKTLVQTSLAGLMEDEQFVRKMRFGKDGSAPKLVGTKYARWGLTIADVEYLYDLQASLRGQRRPSGGVYEGPSQELTRTFEGISEAFYLPMEQVRAMDQKALDDVFPRIPLSAFGLDDQELLTRAGRKKNGEFIALYETQAYEKAMRAMDTAESGYGSQLIGAQYVGELWEGARKESRIFALLDTFEMLAPTVYVPVEVDIPELLFVAENTASNSSNYTTVKTGSNRVQIDAKKFVIHQMWSGEMDEDSIIPFVPFLRRQAELSLQHYSDSLALNGDTTNAGTGNINLDDADPADTKHYLAFDGIRHGAIVDNTGNKVDHAGAAVTYAALLGLREKMLDATYLMDWGHPTMAEDLVFVGNPTTVDRASLLDEVITIDKMGPRATVLTGQQAQIGPHPFISSMAMSKTEADGKVSTTGSNNTLGQVAAFNRRGYKVGWRRRVQVETERLPATDQTRLVYSLRMGLGRFTPTGAASGIEHAAVLYNIANA